MEVTLDTIYYPRNTKLAVDMGTVLTVAGSIKKKKKKKDHTNPKPIDDAMN